MQAIQETGTLIAADKVKGTKVYNSDGENLGEVDDLMIDKRSGQVAYAIMSFGGFLGIGDRYHPLPWSILTYDPERGGYVVDLSREVLERAPAFAAGGAPDWGNREYETGIHDYYGVSPYWGALW